MRELKEFVIGFAEFYGEQLSEMRLELYCQALSGITRQELVRAAGEVMRDPKVMRFPLPAVLLERIRPAANPEHDALEASSRIVQAISDYGWTNPGPARAFIGELGWRVVEREGGWETLCEKVRSEQIPTYRAQWRESAKAIQARAQRGELGAPGLPEPKRDRDELPTNIGGLLLSTIKEVKK